MLICFCELVHQAACAAFITLYSKSGNATRAPAADLLQRAHSPTYRMILACCPACVKQSPRLRELPLICMTPHQRMQLRLLRPICSGELVHQQISVLIRGCNLGCSKLVCLRKTVQPVCASGLHHAVKLKKKELESSLEDATWAATCWLTAMSTYITHYYQSMLVWLRLLPCVVFASILWRASVLIRGCHLGCCKLVCFYELVHQAARAVLAIRVLQTPRCCGGVAQHTQPSLLGAVRNATPLRAYTSSCIMNFLCPG